MRSITVLILIMAAAIAAMVLIRPAPADASQHWTEVTSVQASLESIRQRLVLRIALDQQSQRTRGYPERIEPAWFGDAIPRSPWFSDQQPWVEVASGADTDREHPRCIVALGPADGSFWYNPVLGVVRARVPAGLMDAEAVDLYNAANESNLTSILP